jgi:Prophage minor tail protein Z (GPZ)
MMAMVIDSKSLAKAQKTLGRISKGAPKALSLAMNRTVRAGRTEVSKQTRAVYSIKQKDLYSTLSVNFASAGSMRAEIRSKHSGMLPLFDFKVSPKRINSGRMLTASVRVGGGGSLGRAFIGQMKSGHVGVFARRGSKRLPIVEDRTISAPIMISQAHVAEPAMERMQEVFSKRLDHEIGRLLAAA